MRRSSVLYRKLWYAKKRRTGRLRILLCFSFIVIILAVSTTYAENRIVPYILEISEYRTNSLISSTVYSVLNKNFADGFSYNDIVNISKDSNGHITAIQTDVVKMNKICAEISCSLQEQLSAIGNDKISVPFGVLLGKAIFSGTGPDFHIRVVLAGDVKTDLKSEFSSAGVNQTKHSIYLEVKTQVGVVVPLMKKTAETVTIVPIAETIIVGSVPDVYLDK